MGGIRSPHLQSFYLSLECISRNTQNSCCSALVAVSPLQSKLYELAFQFPHDRSDGWGGWKFHSPG